MPVGGRQPRQHVHGCRVIEGFEAELEEGGNVPKDQPDTHEHPRSPRWTSVSPSTVEEGDTTAVVHGLLHATQEQGEGAGVAGPEARYVGREGEEGSEQLRRCNALVGAMQQRGGRRQRREATQASSSQQRLGEWRGRRRRRKLWRRGSGGVRG